MFYDQNKILETEGRAAGLERTSLCTEYSATSPCTV